MTFRRWGFYWFLPLLLLPAFPQAVVSARAGLIHFVEGSVLLDGRTIQPEFGRFKQMKDGSELKAEAGRAEVILTPGLFARLDENSAIRLLSGSLQDTRLQLVSGALIIDSENAAGSAPVSIASGAYQVHLRGPGRYRIDSSPGQLKVEHGKAEVVHGNASLVVNAGFAASFFGELVARTSADEPLDSLERWNLRRAESISESNATAGNATDLSTAMQSWNNDPAALLGVMGGAGYIPLSSLGVRAPYDPLLGSGLFSPYSGLWGLGSFTPFLVYPRQARGYSPYRYSPSIGVGRSAFPRYGAVGTGPYGHPPAAVRPVAPIQTSPGMGHLGGRR